MNARRPLHEERPAQGPGEGPNAPEGYHDDLTLFGQELTEVNNPDGPWPCIAPPCGRPTRRLTDRGPLHSACEPRDTYLDAPETSHVAGKVAKKSRGRLAELVLGVLERNPAGLIDQEIAARLPSENGPSLTKARLALVRDGRVCDSGETRPTTRGVDAVIWRVVR